MIDTDNQARRAQRDAQRNLERVLAAAHELFAERGAEVTMEEVARRAGVGIGTIYRRFPSKEHLFAAVSRRLRRHAPLPARRRRGRGQPAAKAARAGAGAIPARGGPGAAAGPAAHPDAHCGGAALEQQQLYETLHALLSQIIAEGQRQGLLAWAARPAWPRCASSCSARTRLRTWRTRLAATPTRWWSMFCALCSAVSKGAP